jgi:hypothetical protein
MKEFTLFNGAAKIIGAGLSTYGIQVEIPDSIAVAAGVLGGVTLLGFLFYRLLKNKSPKEEKCKNGCNNPPTEGDTLQCSLFDVVAIIKLREGHIGVQKDSFFYFKRSYYNKNLPTADLTYYTYHEIGAVLQALGKKSSSFEEYCLDCKQYWAELLIADYEPYPKHSYLLNLLLRK